MQRFHGHAAGDCGSHVSARHARWLFGRHKFAPASAIRVRPCLLSVPLLFVKRKEQRMASAVKDDPRTVPHYRKRRGVREIVASIAQLARLKFLTSGPLSFTIGTLASGADLDYSVLVRCMAFIWISHINSHFVNDYFDYEADRANYQSTGWTGGSRVLVEGKLPRWSALALAMCSSALAVVIAVTLLPAACLPIAAAILGITWFYSLPPFHLAYRGLGELTVTLMFVLLLPILAATANGTGLPIERWLPLAIPLGLQIYSRMLVMNMSDLKADIAANKRTMAVRLGLPNTIMVYTTMQTLSYVLALAGALCGLASPKVVVLFVGLTARRALRLAQRLGSVRQNAGDWDPSIPQASIRLNALSMVAFLSGLTMERYGVPLAFAAPIAMYVAAAGGL